MRSFFRSLLPSQSRWQLNRKRNRKRLKDLLLHSFSFKEKCPSDNSPTMLLAWRPLWSVVMRKRRNLKDNCLNQGQKKNKNRKASTTYSPALIPSPCSLCICGKHLGSFIPGWRTPVPSRVAGSERASVWLLVVVEERSLSLPTSLSGPSQSSHPPHPLLHQAPRPIPDALKHG